MQERMKRLAGLLASVAMTGGCTTHLSSARDTGADLPPPGIPYRLPVKSFVVEASWTPESCRYVGLNKSDNLEEFEIPLSLTGKFSEELGEGDRLVIDYSHMTNSFKTGQVDVSYWKVGEGKDARQTGLLKSFNGEIKGEEAAAIKAGIGAVGSIAKLALPLLGVLPGSGGAAFVGGKRVPTLVCDDALFDKGDKPGAIGYLNTSDKKLKGIAKNIEKETVKFTMIKSRTIEKLSPGDQIIFDQAVAEIDKLTKQKENIEKTVATLKTAYQFTKTETIVDLANAKPAAPPNDYVIDKQAQSTTVITPDSEALAELMVKALKCNPDLKQSESQCDAAKGEAASEFKVKLDKNIAKQIILANVRLISPSDAEFKPTSAAALTAAAARGLVYREPQAARFWLEAPGIPDGDTGGPYRRLPEVIAEGIVMIPQIGRITILLLKSGFAEKSGLAAEFEPDGMPSKITYKAIEAGGAALLESLKLGADEAAGIATSIRTAREAREKEAEGAELAALNKQIALLTAQNSLAALQKTPDPEVGAREAELQLLRFEKEKAELIKAIGQ